MSGTYEKPLNLEDPPYATIRSIRSKGEQTIDDLTYDVMAGRLSYILERPPEAVNTAR